MPAKANPQTATLPVVLSDAPPIYIHGAVCTQKQTTAAMRGRSATGDEVQALRDQVTAKDKELQVGTSFLNSSCLS